jgi:hypothetical protein
MSSTTPRSNEGSDSNAGSGPAPSVREVVTAMFVSSRPLSWVNTAFPFAATYFMVVREVDLIFVLGTLYFLVP